MLYAIKSKTSIYSVVVMLATLAIVFLGASCSEDKVVVHDNQDDRVFQEIEKTIIGGYVDDVYHNIVEDSSTSHVAAYADDNILKYSTYGGDRPHQRFGRRGLDTTIKVVDERIHDRDKMHEFTVCDEIVDTIWTQWSGTLMVRSYDLWAKDYTYGNIDIKLAIGIDKNNKNDIIVRYLGDDHE